MNGISKETFMSADNETRYGMLYDMLGAIYKRSQAGCSKQAEFCEKRHTECGERFGKIENSKWLDRGFIVLLTGLWAWVASWIK